jgi:hypothetical protein
VTAPVARALRGSRLAAAANEHGIEFVGRQLAAKHLAQLRPRSSRPAAKPTKRR